MILMRFSTKKLLLNSFVLYTITELLSKALPFLVFPLVITYLQPDDFGFVTNFNVLIQIFGAFVGLHLGTYITATYYKSSEEEFKNIISSTLIINFIISCFVVLVIIFSYNLIFKLTAIPLKYQIYSIITVLSTSIFSLFTTLLRLKENPKFFSLFVLLNVFFSTALTFILLHFFKLGLEGRILSIFMPALFFGFISLYYFISNKILVLNFNKVEFYNQLRFGIPMLPHSLSFWLKTGFDRLIITNCIGLTANGIFSIGATFGSIFFILNTAFNNAYVPYLYKKLSDENLDSNDKIKIVKELYIYVFVYLIIILLGYFVISLIITNYFKNYMESLLYLPYFLIFNVFNVLYQIAVNFIFFKKKTKFLGLITFSITLLQGVLALILVKNYSLHGVGFSMVFASFVLFCIVFFYSNRIYKMPWLLN
ncbi:hypothetical protein C3729_12675 [Cloacibacterium normanense]|uniref:Polysaccharide biosynthesis family protein n=2 Tax=Cloacibacterium normanense TaxID=237258 RepID=A0A2S7I1X4_9FLAO|nr:hypothetical protein C3729_12675 [Cloacibacterium normanense]